MPKVSVIIPTHNRPDYIGKAIKSVLDQTYQDFEIIVVDDGLEERAGSVINKIADSRIKYIKHEQERGGAAARNTGIRAAQGEYIAFLDDDDEWLPEKLDVQIRTIRNLSNKIGFCFTAVKQRRNKGDIVSHVPEGVVDYYLTALRTFKIVLTSSLLVRRFIFDTIGLFDESFPSHQEAELMIRLSKKYRGVGIDKPLVIMTVFDLHESIGKNLSLRIEGRKKILQKHKNEFGKYPEFLARHYFQLGLFYRDAGKWSEAQKVFKKAFIINFKFRYFLHYLYLLLRDS